MPYLTYEEYLMLSQHEIEEPKFKKLLPKATAIIDNITSHFYARYIMATDNVWRVRQFKMALCAQIEYFDVLGATTFEEINNSPQTFSAGRTSVSNASRYNPSGANESKPLIAEDVFVYLDGTGLLSAAVSVW
ncbi:hypothetical protein ABZ756_06980 [Mammaliicoccus sciuri]